MTSIIDGLLVGESRIWDRPVAAGLRRAQVHFGPGREMLQVLRVGPLGGVTVLADIVKGSFTIHRVVRTVTGYTVDPIAIVPRGRGALLPTTIAERWKGIVLRHGLPRRHMHLRLFSRFPLRH
jgi:hypothetical protein